MINGLMVAWVHEFIPPSKSNLDLLQILSQDPHDSLIFPNTTFYLIVEGTLPCNMHYFCLQVTDASPRRPEAIQEL
jgi:hypothetical protein